MHKFILLVALSLFAIPVSAQNDDHLSEVDGLRVLHAWTPATAGSEALIYMEIENASETLHTLTGAVTEEGLIAELVGFTYIDGVEGWQTLQGISIASGQHLNLAPRTIALRLSSVNAALSEGDEIKVSVNFGDLSLDVHVVVESKSAIDHSHAGHSH